MKAPNASLLTRSLLESARQDGPSAASRARIWEEVALTPHLSLVAQSAARQASHSAPPPSAVIPTATPASVTPAVAMSGALLGGFSAGKLLIAGAIAGSVLTVGLGMVLFRGNAGPKSTTPASITHPPVGVLNGRDSQGGPLASDAPSTSSPQTSPNSVVESARATSPAAVPAGSRGDSPFVRAAPPTPVRPTRARSAAISKGIDGQDVLTREASLVSGARTELLQGRPDAALELLDSAARGGSHSLEPEQLSLRARALRALGRESEAARVEGMLRARFPEHFLAH